MAVIPVASKAGGLRDKLLTNTATGVLAAIRDHYLARFGSLADITVGSRHVRFTPDCVAKVGGMRRVRNNQIQKTCLLNQSCAAN